MQYAFEVVGESFYQKNLKKITRIKNPTQWFEMEKVANLQLEEDNLHDPNAVKVSIDGLTVGYFSRAHAKCFRQGLKDKTDTRTSFNVPCLVHGSFTDERRFLVGVRLAIDKIKDGDGYMYYLCEEGVDTSKQEDDTDGCLGAFLGILAIGFIMLCSWWISR